MHSSLGLPNSPYLLPSIPRPSLSPTSKFSKVGWTCKSVANIQQSRNLPSSLCLLPPCHPFYPVPPPTAPFHFPHTLSSVRSSFLGMPPGKCNSIPHTAHWAMTLALPGTTLPAKALTSSSYPGTRENS